MRRAGFYLTLAEAGSLYVYRTPTGGVGIHVGLLWIAIGAAAWWFLA